MLGVATTYRVATDPRGHFGWQKLYKCTGGSVVIFKMFHMSQLLK